MPKSNNKTTKIKRKIYLDHASSAIAGASNPSAIHELGVMEKKKLETSRETIAGILNVRHGEVIFTSGATESNNLAILGLLQKFRGDFLPHIVTSNIEHVSVLEVCKKLEATKRAEVTYVKVEKTGVVDPRKIKKALKKNTILVSVMYANNEIGTIQPISEIAKEIRHFNKINGTKVYFHTDATQAINYLPIKIPTLGVDLLSFNGAKIYGPKGVGVLYVKSMTPVGPIMFGGNQEMGLRPGTENVAGAVEIAKALQAVEKTKDKESKRLKALRDYFIKSLSKIPYGKNLIINGELENRLPNNVNITVPNIPSDLLVIELSARGIMASAKSACKSGDGKASHVIRAINPNIKEEDGSLRFSLGRATSKKDIDESIKSLAKILDKLSNWYH